MANYDARALAAHKRLQGKLEVRSKMALKNKEDLSIAYTPGVAAVSSAIGKNVRLARTHTLKGRTVAVISDGSAILGLGNLGPEAALPVMEGKAVLFKYFAGLDAFPIVLATQKTEEVIAAVKAVAPTFGGINLEDIAAPRCFEIEERLKRELNIPVMHDDQHGTAIVVLAALTNALKFTRRTIGGCKIVVSGAGAAAIATTKLLIDAGADAKRMIIVDSKGAIVRTRADLTKEKRELAEITNDELFMGDLSGALRGADVFIGVSKGNTVTKADVDGMAPDAILFPMANPTPEIAYEVARKTRAAVIGTGRSDYPNQINNVLAFPGVFRGAIDVGATQITQAMKLAAAQALAGLVSKQKLAADYVIPKPFDKRVAPAVAKAVAAAWKKQ